MRCRWLIVAPPVVALSCANILGVDGDFFEVSAGGAAPSTSAGGMAGMGGEGGASSTTVGMGGAGGAGGMGAAGPCGNGALEVGEQCDDNNVVSTDGCSNSCQLEGSANECPTGAIISLGPAGIWILDDGTGRNNVGGIPCGANPPADLIYQITPSQDGVLAIDVVSNFNDTVVAVRTACGGGAADRCERDDMMAATTFPVQTGVPLHVVVTAAAGMTGQFTLHIYYQ